MYKKLLIEAGGGIISRSQQSEQAEAATIAIGLGGTGISCLRELKKEVYNKLKPDNGEDSVVPEYKHIKFLAVDSDETSLGDTGAFDTINKGSEFFDISCNDINELLKSIAKLKDNTPELAWLCTADVKTGKQGLSIYSAKAGAGGVRQVGRLLLIQKSKQFVEKLTTIITTAVADLAPEAPVNVHIFTGISGGTGAGTFLDVCYLVDHVLEQTSLASRAETCGYFFLPDVNLSSNKLDSNTQKYIKVNGFASMKDFDYCMNFANNGGEWNQLYSDFTIKTINPPVNLAYLVTATDANGAIKSNGYDYAMHVVVDCVLEFMTKPHIPENTKEKNDFSLKSHIGNISKNRDMVEKRHGGCYDYCVIGASSAYLPYKEITTYLASKIFESFNYLENIEPSDGDIDAFISKNGLKYEDLKRELSKDVPSVSIYDIDKQVLKDQILSVSSADSFPPVLKRMVESGDTIFGKYAENKKRLITEVEDSNLEVNTQISSLISRIKKGISDACKNPEEGPYFAAKILHSPNTKDLSNVIFGYIGENSGLLANARATMTLRNETLQVAFTKIKNKPNKTNRKDYVEAWHAKIVQQTVIDFYTVMDIILNQLHEQIVNLYDNYYKKFNTVLDNLKETFAANLSNLSTPVDNANNSYFKQIIKISDLKESLDETVKAMKVSDKVNKFVGTMLKDDSIWISNDENKICTLVTKYFLSELSSFTNRTIMYYLQIKYNTNNPQELTNKIYEDIIKPSYDLATPLFWNAGSNLFNIDDACKLKYCSVPETSPEIKAAADKLTEEIDSTITRRTVLGEDRIAVFQFYCGVPLFAYKGVSNYINGYLADPSVGKHLYEGVESEDKDFTKFPNIIPISGISEDEYGNKQKNNSDEYDYAVDNGVINFEMEKDEILGNCKINIFDETKIADCINKIEASVASNNLVKMQNTLDNLPESFDVADVRFLPNSGAKGHQKKCCKDHALNSLYFMDVIKEQNNNIRKYNEAKKKLVKVITGVGHETQSYKKFVQALCCRIIFKASKFSYKYKTDEGAFAEEIELTSRKHQPYGEDMPLYSAFVNYKSLPDDEKVAIDKAVDIILDSDDTYESVYLENKPSIKELILSQGKEDADAARKLYPIDAKSIIKDLEEINGIL